MTEAVIVATARTPLGKSWRGSFNMTRGATLAGHAIEQAVQRSGIGPSFAVPRLLERAGLKVSKRDLHLQQARRARAVAETRQ